MAFRCMKAWRLPWLRRRRARRLCTAPITHAKIIARLLQAGVPVFTELNLVDDGYDELIAAAKEKGVPLFLSSTMLYRGETQYIKRRVQEFSRPVNYIYHIGQYLPDWHPWENYKNFLWAISAPAVCARYSALTCPGFWIHLAR